MRVDPRSSAAGHDAAHAEVEVQGQATLRRPARSPGRGADQHVTLYPGPIAGPGVVVPTPEQVLEALSGFRGEAPFEELAPDLLPMFERRRPMPPDVPPSLTVVLHPG